MLWACLLALGLHASHARGFTDWLSQRDAGVVRQTLDYSCGIASLATILSYYFNEPVSERALLAQFAGDRPQLSFEDLAQLARARGYRALGVSVSYADLQRLRHPAIVALDLGERQHFSVLRRARADGVSLADPSWGNHAMHREAFEARFAIDAERSRGRALVILAADGTPGDPDFLEARRPGPLVAPGLLLRAR